ncbi:MAG TPA: VWA domain-containing protein [Chloroflexota bacterium]|nr:VWA domain-containing protein [Chloroflexota bacterium]
MSAFTPEADPRDPYVTLGVPPGTPFDEIKLVYRRLVRELHPDVNPRARARFDAVQAAFDVLRAQNVRARKAPAPPTLVEQPSTPLVETGALHAEDIFEDDHSAPAPPAAEEIGVQSPATAPLLQLQVVPGRDRLLLQPRAQMFYALFELKLREDVTLNEQPLNLALVLDHSSSMQRNDKLQRLKEAVSRIIDMMSPRDYLSIITFSDRASILLPSAPLGNKRAAKEALDGIRCRGGTEISAGIRAGLQELDGHSATLLSQLIVLTDGQTYGDDDLCLELASQAGERQVQITALGLGDDWNSGLLDEMAARTGGYADYVQRADQLAGIFEENLRALQHTALRNLCMVVTTAINSRVLRATWVAPGIKALPVPSEIPAGQRLTLDLGRMSNDRDYRLLLEFVIASRTPGIADAADIQFTYDVPGMGLEHECSDYHLAVNFVERWDADPPVDLRVHDALRKITAHRLQEQAMQAIQEGQTQKGTANLRTAAKHLEAAGCNELAQLAKTEADRVERQGQAQAGTMKRIIYGTRKLG